MHTSSHWKKACHLKDFRLWRVSQESPTASSSRGPFTTLMLFSSPVQVEDVYRPVELESPRNCRSPAADFFSLLHTDVAAELLPDELDDPGL